jgi:S1-C subfamily serine protease
VASDAQSIGFAIPINQAQQAISSYEKTGKIIKPYLGVSYMTVTPDIASSNNLSVSQGALITASQGQDAVISGSPADKAGLKENDIILEINGQVLDQNNSLGGVISQYNPNDEVTIKYLRGSKDYTVKVKLGSTS